MLVNHIKHKQTNICISSLVTSYIICFFFNKMESQALIHMPIAFSYRVVSLGAFPGEIARVVG